MPKKVAKIIFLLTVFTFLANGVFAAPTSNLLEENARSTLSTQDTAFIGEAGLGTRLSAGKIVSNIIKIFLAFLGVIFIILIIYAGFTWMTATGSEEKISKAKQIMLSAFIGVAIVFLAYAITFFVIDKLLEATRGGTGLK
ncbi:MAG: hypothetical protein A3D39_03305 [Candidatus Buchananbacteria bacterium RIFCSPHIGHO2_02_FULL_39_17]|uniref:TrbC/VIRB2 family protein n=1 Tax=Candidatus Buchananbacteria bacterium RIFCSPLOWO2_01_FULL_40_23b TaxID=1797544 RepID=A0A1G1YP71_9BACT|nr:MAG: hypothetical protein A3D39_03305 [Candidatus Buchananbacteria bacterium RIFCSPHIGHO2_02_FULL_39_17]OGY54091.1 MAG: hypothetical protein A2912_01830 [Candidatus Buchananbacteria bacterium RIFCSPLOWO2_01_FULL_40_23b]